MTCTGYMSVYWASNAESAACSAPGVHQLKISPCPETAGALVELLPQPALNTNAPSNRGNHENRAMSIHTARSRLSIHLFTDIGESSLTDLQWVERRMNAARSPPRGAPDSLEPPRATSSGVFL